MMLGEIKKVEQDFKDITGEDGLNPTCPSWFALYHLTCILHSHLINYNLNICDVSNNEFLKNLSHMRIIEMTLKAFKVINFNLHVLDRRVDVQWCQTIISSPQCFFTIRQHENQFVFKNFMPTFNCDKLRTMKRNGAEIKESFYAILCHTW